MPLVKCWNGKKIILENGRENRAKTKTEERIAKILEQ